ncbi:MAG: transposase [Candidatus Cloacimonadaceae bacterium]
MNLLPVLREYVTELSQKMDNKSIAQMAGLSEDTEYQIDKTNLQKLLIDYDSKIPLFSFVAKDEIAIRMGHYYCTVVVNLLDKKIIWIELRSTKNTLCKLIKHFPRQFSTLKAISMDLWKPYELAVQELCLQVHIVYDKFHISRWLNGYIDTERRCYQR